MASQKGADPGRWVRERNAPGGRALGGWYAHTLVVLLYTYYPGKEVMESQCCSLALSFGGPKGRETKVKEEYL